ncbi:Variant SH3 domain, partial [Rhizoctonia solani]
MADLTAHVISHVLDRVRSDLRLLESIGCLAGQDLEIILAKLPVEIVANEPTLILTSSVASPPPIASPGAMRRAPPIPPSRYTKVQPASLMAEAKWNYNSDDPADLTLKEGDLIEIIEETSPDWWKGRLNGREGLFPSNRCVKLEPTMGSGSTLTAGPRRFLSTHNASNTFSATTGLNKIGLTPASVDPEKKDKYSQLKSTMVHSAASGVGAGAAYKSLDETLGTHNQAYAHSFNAVPICKYHDTARFKVRQPVKPLALVHRLVPSTIGCHPLLAHLISRLEADVRFLADQGHISRADSQTVLGVFSRAGTNASVTNTMSAMNIGNRDAPNTGMPTPYGAPSPHPMPVAPAFSAPSLGSYNTPPPAFPGGPPASSSSPAPNNALKRPVPPPPPAGAQCKAMWDYNLDGSLKDDLSFRAGDIIQIVKEDNADWWTGRLNGREAMFPANHVEKLPNTPSYGYDEKQQHMQAHQHYAPPPGPPTAYQHGAPAQAGPPTEEEKKKFKLGKYGGMAASGAATGVGFGIGAGLVNAIF